VDNPDSDKLPPSQYNYDKGRPSDLNNTPTAMCQSESPANTPAPEDYTNRPSPDSSDHLEALKEAIAEAEDLCREFAIQARIEALRSWREVERLSKELEEEAVKRAARHDEP